MARTTAICGVLAAWALLFASACGEKEPPAPPPIPKNVAARGKPRAARPPAVPSTGPVRPVTPPPVAVKPPEPPKPVEPEKPAEAPKPPEPEKPAATTAKERLEQTKARVNLDAVALSSALGEIAAKADVDIALADTATEGKSEEELTIQSLHFDQDLPASQILSLLCKLSSLEWTEFDGKIVVHAIGSPPTADTPLTPVPRPAK